MLLVTIDVLNELLSSQLTKGLFYKLTTVANLPWSTLIPRYFSFFETPTSFPGASKMRGPGNEVVETPNTKPLL